MILTDISELEANLWKTVFPYTGHSKFGDVSLDQLYQTGLHEKLVKIKDVYGTCTVEYKRIFDLVLKLKQHLYPISWGLTFTFKKWSKLYHF